MIRASCASMTTNSRVPHVSILSWYPLGASPKWLRTGKAQTTQGRVILSGAAWGPTQWGKRSEGSAFASLSAQIETAFTEDHP